MLWGKCCGFFGFFKKPGFFVGFGKVGLGLVLKIETFWGSLVPPPPPNRVKAFLTKTGFGVKNWVPGGR